MEGWEGSPWFRGVIETEKMKVWEEEEACYLGVSGSLGAAFSATLPWSRNGPTLCQRRRNVCKSHDRGKVFTWRNTGR